MEVAIQLKDLAGLIILPLALLGGIGAACLSHTVREALFFLSVSGCVMADRINISFLSNHWYRGTTRGFEISAVDLFAVSLLAGSLFARWRQGSRLYWPASLGPLLVLLFWGAVSAAVSDPKLFGLFELTKIFRGILVFLAAAFFVRTERDLFILLAALSCGLLYESALVLKQRYWNGLYRATGNLDHANSLSMYLCAVIPVLTAAAAASVHRCWRLCLAGCAGLGAVAMVMTVSRAGIPILFLIVLGTVACCISWRPTLKKLLGAGAAALALAGLLVWEWENLKARYITERSFEEEYLDEKSEGRGHYLRLAQVILADRFFGVGLNNWSYWVCKKYGAEMGLRYENYDDLTYIPAKEALPHMLYAPPAHSLAALMAGELGWPGLALFGCLWLRWFQAGSRFIWQRSSRLYRHVGAGIFFATLGVFLQSATEWTYRQTPILFTFHLLLGTLAALCYFDRQRRRSQFVSCEWQAPAFRPEAAKTLDYARS